MLAELIVQPTFLFAISEGISMRRAFSLPVSLLLSTALILCCSIVSLAQNREKFVISAKAGGINAITGQARVHSKGEWRLAATERLRTIWMPATGCAPPPTAASKSF